MATFTNDAYAGLFNGIVGSDPVYANNPNFRRSSFFHIIHNGGWQYFDRYDRYEHGFDHFRLFNLPLDKAGDFTDPTSPHRLNCMATGVRLADRVITVSRAYAKQIKTASDGLEHMLSHVTGISNGVRRDFLPLMQRHLRETDFVATWYPQFMAHLHTDTSLSQEVATRYPELLQGPHACDAIADPIRRGVVTRVRNKLLLQLERGLTVDPDRLLFSMLHRITEQNGFQLLLEASEGIFKQLGWQGIIGGPPGAFDQRGEELARGLPTLHAYCPEQVSVSIGLQDVCVPLLASDVFLMPSLYEPGGIAQLEAIACGCPVVARATSGLQDTVRPLTIDGRKTRGNGFLFTEPTPAALYDAMQRCADFFHNVEARQMEQAGRHIQRSIYTRGRAAKRYLETIYATKEIVRRMPDNSPRSLRTCRHSVHAPGRM